LLPWEEERWHHQSLSIKERESTVLLRYLRTPCLLALKGLKHKKFWDEIINYFPFTENQVFDTTI
jgi:hypothetical protein